METPKVTPRSYQSEVIKAALSHDGFGLFLEQRVGKTLVALWLGQLWGCEINLIICPKKAIPVWKSEIVKAGSDPSHFSIISFESYRIHQLQYLKQKWDLVIVDESHRIKERKSQQTRAIWKLSKLARKRLILSGSPQGNGMEDYYAQLKFIRPDLFSSWERFSDRYCIIEDRWRQGQEDPFPTIVGYKNQEEFKQILASISFRVKRDEVAKVKTLVRSKKLKITPSEAFWGPYNELDQKLMAEIQGDLITAPMVLVKASKLHQLCGGFIKNEDREVIHAHSEKLDFFWGLMDGELKGQSVVVVANYKPEMDAIARGLQERGIPYVQIRGGRAHQYDPHDRSQVTILNPSAGEAINLAHHDHMVIYSMNYSYLKWAQFKDRIVVVDTPMVKYYYLTMEGTMDEIVYEAVLNKRRLSEEVLSVFRERRAGQPGDDNDSL